MKSFIAFFQNSVYDDWFVILLIGVFLLALFFSYLVLSRFVYVKVRFAYHRQLRKAFKPEIDIKAAQEQMIRLARNHTVSKKSARTNIIREINRQGFKHLKRMKRELCCIPAKIIMLVPSARWLFDNYYLLYKEMSTVIKTANFKKKDFPVLSNGSMKGYFRIYRIASDIMGCSLNHLNEETIVSLLNAYQSHTPLTSAELWAFPSVLKGCLMESILDTSGGVLENIKTKEDADLFMSKMVVQLRTSSKTIFQLMKENLNKDKLQDYSYMSHILYCLKNVSADEAEIKNWLLEELDYDPIEHQNIVTDLIRKGTNLEAISKNTIRSLIVSLKEISDLNWEYLFEKVSPIEKVLQKDPSDVYSAMDFHTRDLYRHEIEKLAKYSRLEESQVAKKALFLALSASSSTKKVHIGTYIVGKSKDQLYDSLNKPRCFMQRMKTRLHDMRGFLYFAGISLLFLLIGFSVFFYIRNTLAPTRWWEILVFVLIFLVPVISVCIEIMNHLSTAIVKPEDVLSMDFSKEIPDRYRTFVVIPVILGNTEQVKDYVGKLERYYLGNMQSNLYFAILGDYKDAPSRVTEEDDKILSFTKAAIEKLNQKYPSENFRFNLFMRYRKYNESEGCWMGWERKRGKIEEFNALLLGESDTTYDVVLCNRKLMGTFRYVITLDADTELIRESAGKLVGIMAHPLNRPILNAKKDKIIDGYSIVQSEIRNRLSSVRSSFFATLFANNPGIDTYSTLVSDVYHDTFREGIFYGKGIYDIRVFHRLFRGTIPENSVLSHDLLESCYARCAFASGVKLMDKYPSSFAAYIKREHRWIRGDWQLLPWLFKFSPIGILSRWKVLDNIRRSLVQISWFVLIVANLFLFPEIPFLWMLFVFFSPMMQLVLSLQIFVQKLRHLESSLCFKNIFSNMWKILLQGLLVFILIPHRAYISVDAIVRALYRIFFSHKKMLEWNTAEEVEKGIRNTFRGNLSMMFQSVIAGILLLLSFPFSITLSGRICCIAVSFFWCIGPLVAYLVSKPSIVSQKLVFAEDELLILRRHARKIWHFVEDHATEATHWLCPDNLQIFPIKKVTSKTSPTNIGLQLMSVLAARDMGYLTLSAFVDRVEKVVGTIQEMSKWHGHLYNWYDIDTLDTLKPKYVSTVDSGNLAGYLITVKNALIFAMNLPVLSKSRLKGLQDTLLLSGMDCPINTADLSLEGWKRTLLDVRAQTEGEQKAWENKKWVRILQETCTEFLDELDEYLSSQRLPVRNGNENSVGNRIGGTRGIEVVSGIACEIVSLNNCDSTNINKSENGGSGSDDSDGGVGQNIVDNNNDVTNQVEMENSILQHLVTGTLLGIANSGNIKAMDLVSRMQALIDQLDYLVRSTDFKLLYDEKQSLFRIGYHAESQTMDSSKYDLLASEARQASFIAIAKGDVPQKHWFKLGRPLTIVNHLQSLVSWSGSMFEYLMPELIIKSFPNSLIYQSCRAMVADQIKYGRKNDVPWGISEAQYYRFDTDSNYQYRAFGVTDLSFQSSLQNDFVIAPYATMLALDITPKETMLNIKQLIALGVESEYGFYESIDYSVPDTVSHKRYSIIKSYMMHHQGMSLVSIDNAINNHIMQKRFHQDPIVQATEILLEEYSPSNLFTLDNKEYNLRINPVPYALNTFESRTFFNPSLTYPSAHVLCNNHYMLMMTTGGQGFSKFNDIMINRWRPDTSRNLHGMFFYVRNLKTKDIFSTTYYPLIREPDEYKAIFSIDKMEYFRKDGDIKTHSEITISPIDNIEVRRLTFRNDSSEDLQLEVTSYLEIVNDTYESDLSHPAFSKLFNEMEYIPESAMLVGKRRARSDKENKRFILHFVLYNGKWIKGIEYETDKKRFIGRGNSLLNPDAMNSTLALSNQDGQTSDPIASLRVAIGVAAGRSSTISFLTGYCETWEEVLSLHHKYGVTYSLHDIFELSYVDSELELFYLNITSHQINIIQDIVGSIYYPSNLFRTSEDVIKRNRKSQTDLWRYGISGDNPIMLLRISDVEDIRSAKDVIMAYEFFKKNLIKVDLVLLNEQNSSYMNDLNNMLFDLTSNLRMFDEDPKNRSLFILQSCTMTPEELDLLLTAAKLVINAKTGFSYWFTKEILLDKVIQSKKSPPYFSRRDSERLTNDGDNDASVHSKIPRSHKAAPEFFNQIGGFINDGEEYEIRLQDGQKTPMPWINVIANDHFGFQISESGSGYTWAVNSRENKLTTWSNDPVSDPASEIVYLRDEETGEYTSITSGPINDNGLYTVRHGHGYSVFEHQSLAVKQKMTVFAAAEDPVKTWHITLRNTTDTQRTLSVSLYLEWVLGVAREKTLPFIVTEMDETANVMTAYNAYSINFSQQYAFVSASEKIVSYTGNRTEFVGGKGSFTNPEALRVKELSNNTGAGYDPCSVIKINIDIEPNGTKEIVLVMGQTDNPENIGLLVEKHCHVTNARKELEKVKAGWKTILGQMKVKTPDRAMNILINEWLLYQVIACRLRARSAFYQCGGAYGFRDQLQDVLALLHVEPERVKAQILLCSSRQFPEGDVQHWWHAHTGQGIRTRMSDDLLWLPYAVAIYIRHTGDYSILEEQVDYLSGPLLKPDEVEIYFVPGAAGSPESVYRHCIQAIEKSLGRGEHGLPLMGSGDWNDGMNRVGVNGTGESVWLAWFLDTVLKEFAPLCAQKGEIERSGNYRSKAKELVSNIEAHAWDGEWYLRAYFDNGTPLGSEKSEECKIDSISQSWAILSGDADSSRGITAIRSADKYLVREEDGVICLLTPPFDTAPMDPGYIKGYYPGVRENGGQYTHAAIWLAMAHTRLRDGDGAYKLFSMMNPVNASATYKGSMKYEQEPYVVTADIYSKAPYNGKGGWSWYTGSAGWMYQALVGELLGIKKIGTRLFIDPTIPSDWNEYSIEYRFGTARYTIHVQNPDSLSFGCDSLRLDGRDIAENSFELSDDGMEHSVIVVMRNILRLEQ